MYQTPTIIKWDEKEKGYIIRQYHHPFTIIDAIGWGAILLLLGKLLLKIGEVFF
jgi:hypothetical protein